MKYRKLNRDFIKHSSSFTGNELATITGYIAQAKFCSYFDKITKIDENGYDAIVRKDFTITLEGKKVKLKKGDKVEIKCKADDFVNSKVLAYNHDSKQEKYHWLLIYLYDAFDNDRAALISHDEFENKIINVEGTGLSINLTPGIRHNHTNPVYTPLTKLFFEHEIVNLNLLENNGE
tara:strand:+ start:189 stop:719 length:531 start_codon:yes stop_codon:yes gene_type:complete